MIIPDRLADTCRGVPGRDAWLERLPDVIRELQIKWSLSLSAPLESVDATCSWVTFAERADSSRAVLKLGMPHMEAAHEVQGLRFWNGDGIVRLLEADEALNAMLLERCEPGTSLRELPEPDQDVVIAGLLRRLWRTPRPPHPFRPLSFMLNHWAAETIASASKWIDAGLVREGLRLFSELSQPTEDDVLLTTDLHAGNVLRAEREEWLAIDPKPFVGDRAYDATQHLFNCRRRLTTATDSTVRRMADLLELDVERVHLWAFARAAAEPRDAWREESVAIAKMLGSRGG
jgi:streptomycin 6-kinase